MPEDENKNLSRLTKLEKKVSEMKEWENYLSHGGLLEQIMDRVKRGEKKLQKHRTVNTDFNSELLVKIKLYDENFEKYRWITNLKPMEIVGRIEKLEKKVDDGIGSDNVWMMMVQKEISSLRDDIKIQAFDMTVGALAETNAEMIAELKERLDAKDGNSINRICSFYQMGDSEGQCGLYGSNDITKSMFCKDISCEYKNDGEKSVGRDVHKPRKSDSIRTDSTPSKCCQSCDRTIKECVENECSYRHHDICTERKEICRSIKQYYHTQKPKEPPVDYIWPITVEKADLERTIERETWLLEKLYPTHHGNDDYNIYWGEYITFKGKYLKGDDNET